MAKGDPGACVLCGQPTGSTQNLCLACTTGAVAGWCMNASCQGVGAAGYPCPVCGTGMIAALTITPVPLPAPAWPVPAMPAMPAWGDLNLPDRDTCPTCGAELCKELDAYYGRDSSMAELCAYCRLGRRHP